MDKKAKIWIGVLVGILVLVGIFVLITVLVSAWVESGEPCQKEGKWECIQQWGYAKEHQCIKKSGKLVWGPNRVCGRASKGWYCDGQYGRCKDVAATPTPTPWPTLTPTPTE